MPTITADDEKLHEIVNGQPEEKDVAGARQAGVGTRLLIKLGVYIETSEWGRIYGPNTSFKIGANERLPDIGLVAAKRIPKTGEPVGIWLLAPDVAVEVVSPNDFWESVHVKVNEYLTAGVRQVWVVSPECKRVAIHRSFKDMTIFMDNDELICEDLLPGFRCPLSEIFI